MSTWPKINNKKCFLALKNATSASKLKKLKTKLKTKNHMYWDLSVSWTRTTRTQTQKLKKKKKTSKSLSLRNFHFQTRKIIWKWNFLGRNRVLELHFWVRRLWCCACRQSILASATTKPSRPARRAQCNASPEERRGLSWSLFGQSYSPERTIWGWDFLVMRGIFWRRRQE